MKRYILVKEYNPAYGYWLRAYLKKKRIMGDRDYSWKEGQDIIMDMNARGIQDKFFQGYFWSWRDHPEIAPSNFTLLSMAVPVYENERMDLELLTRLDQEAKARQQRVIFTIDDAAEVFNTFYEEFIKKPLSLELKRGATGTALTKYFETEELNQLPNVKIVSAEKAEDARHSIAVKLLERLGKTTSSGILQDIRQTLDQHYDRGMAEASASRSYLLRSEYVMLSFHRTREHETATAFITPARGYGVLKRGYEEVYYPTYHVELSPQ